MSNSRHNLTILPEIFSICRLAKDSGIPDWACAAHFVSITITPQELSVVCPEIQVPEGIQRDAGWRCLKVEGPLELSATGILASLTNPLAQEGISVFAVSTYDTDYLLVKAQQLEKAVKVLTGNRHIVKGRRLAHSAKRKGKMA